MNDAEELTCPSCRKANPRHADLRVCSRCGCELDILCLIAFAAESRDRLAGQCLMAGEWENASQHAEDAWALKHRPQTARIAFLASIARGDLETAAEWLESIRSSFPDTPPLGPLSPK